MKPSIPSQASDALIWDEELNEKQKIAKRKKRGEGPQPGYLGPCGRLLRPAWIMRWACSETPSRPQGDFRVIVMEIIIA